MPRPRQPPAKARRSRPETHDLGTPSLARRGVMWPLISQKEGDWFPSGLGSHDFKGLFGYKVFLTIAMTMWV